MIRRAGRLALFAALGGAVVWSAQPAHAAAARSSVRRVLVISLPGIEWADLQDARVPNLRAAASMAGASSMVFFPIGSISNCGLAAIRRALICPCKPDSNASEISSVATPTISVPAMAPA